MAELAPGDLPAATLARFADEDAAQAAIDATLAAARRYCGWHVSPVRTDEVITLDGPGGRVLSLPTLSLLNVSEIDDDGLLYAPEDLRVSRRKGNVTKRGSGCWSSQYGAITATVTHGLTEAEAADWRAAVISMVTTASLSQNSGRESADLKRKKVDDVEYEWFDALISTDAQLRAKFAAFRILEAP